jgi:hypothetical protein
MNIRAFLYGGKEMSDSGNRTTGGNPLVILVCCLGLLVTLFSGLASGQDRIRAGTITIQRQHRFASQGAVNWGNLTDVKGDESLKIDVVFKINRSNERVRVYELDKATAEYKYNLGGKEGMKGDKGVIEFGSPKYEGTANKRLSPSDGKITLYLDLLKQTYTISGKVLLKDVPLLGKNKFLIDIGGVIRHEEEDKYDEKQDVDEEIEIEGKFKPEDKGVLKGSRNLISDEIKPFFDALKSLIGAETGGTISWDIRVPMLEVHCYDEKISDYRDVTAPKKPDAQITGKKIKLWGKVVPDSLKAENPKWTLQGKTIKKFDATSDKGEVKPLEKSDFEEEKLDFFWFDKGENLKVTFSAEVEKEKLQAQANFSVERPSLEVEIKAPASFIPGTVDGTWELLYGDLNQTGREMQDKNVDPPGDIQWVQIHEVTEILVGHPVSDWAGLSFRTSGKGLDGSYPYAKNRPFRDTPGIPSAYRLSSRQADMKFQTFLMYRPKSNQDDSEWVPVKVVNWSFGGIIEFDETTKAWKVVRSWPNNPQEPKAVDTAVYPTWSMNGDNFPWFEKKGSGSWTPTSKPPGIK